jgi:exodeoxyribonuclease VII large subunit
VLEKLSAAASRLTGDIESVIELAEQRLQTICASAAFRNPILQVRNRQQQLDEIGGNLEELMGDMITDARERLNEYYEQVVRLEPRRLLGRKTVEVNELRSRANAAVSALLSRARMQLTAQGSRLEGLNPRAVLKRGYSITMLKQTGVVLKNAAQAQIGDTLVTELAENLIESKVTKK